MNNLDGQPPNDRSWDIVPGFPYGWTYRFLRYAEKTGTDNAGNY
jgi:hypothetical protein